MIVVGIAGGSASGKTCLAEALAAALGEDALHLSHDRYYHPLPEAWRVRPDDFDFDHPDALETTLLLEHLDALRAGLAVDAPVYAFDRHDRVGTERVRPRPVVLVDGLLVLAEPDLRARFDLPVFVDTPHDDRRSRRISRDIRERGRTEEEAVTRFARHVAPTHDALVEPSRAHAALVVDGRRPLDALVAEVRAALRGRLG